MTDSPETAGTMRLAGGLYWERNLLYDVDAIKCCVGYRLRNVADLLANASCLPRF